MAKLRKKPTKSPKSSKPAASIELNGPSTNNVPKAKPVQLASVSPRLPSVWRLSRNSLALLWRQRKLFLALTGIYTGLSFLLVQSVSGGLNVNGLRNLLAGSDDRLVNGILTFEWLISGSPAAQDAASGAYKLILLVLMSLAYIWALRQVMSGTAAVRVRDAFYKGMGQLVPVLIVLFVLFLQLFPLLIALGLYNVVLTYGFADSPLAKILWGIPALGLSILSLYLTVPTVISAYIATLPGIEPGAALKSGREVVAGRRWMVLRKLIYLPIAIAVAVVVVFIPLLLYGQLLAPWVYFLGSIALVPIVHAYCYLLYRELLP